MEDKVQRQKEHFDSIAERYENSRKHRNHLQLKKLIWSTFLGTGNIKVPENPQVLEPMCGYADGKAILEQHLCDPIRYSGFDYSDVVVRKLAKDMPNIKVWQQDVTVFESDTKYDVIIILGGLHHVPHKAHEVVATLSSALAPGGYFINLEPTNGNAVFGWVRQRIYSRNTLFDEQTERAFEIDELSSMFVDAGLTSVDSFYPGLLSYVLYYNPDAFPWLNIGNPAIVRALFALEKPFMRTRVARALSFATLALWQKPAD